MSNHSEAFVAFDTSKLRNAVAIADPGGRARFGFLARSRTPRRRRRSWYANSLPNTSN